LIVFFKKLISSNTDKEYDIPTVAMRKLVHKDCSVQQRREIVKYIPEPTAPDSIPHLLYNLGIFPNPAPGWCALRLSIFELISLNPLFAFAVPFPGKGFGSFVVVL
jgi:hypothetical protein